jgi:ribulose-phosphate 3-epimerase
MLEIIPSVNAEDWGTVKKRIEIIAPHTEWVHLDVSDGTFTSSITWNNPDDLKSGIPKNVRIEAHLMVAEPEKKIDPWIGAGVRRVILHWEALKSRGFFERSAKKKVESIAEVLRENWVEFGMAVLYRTNPKDIESYVPLLDLAQVLAVEPGPAGQIFRPEALAVVREVKRITRAVKPHVKIEVDGGVNVTNIKDCYIAGANVVAAASAVFSAQEPHLALESLKRAVLG